MIESMTRFHVLCALVAGPQYPYQISRDVAAATADAVVLEAGNLHRRLQQLVEEGLVAESRAPVGERDARRRYYAITRRGRDALRAETDRLQEAVRTARSALAGSTRR